MEDLGHNPDKFGYCKIKDHCKKEHYSQILKHHGQIKLYNNNKVLVGSKLTNLDCGQIKFCKEKIQNKLEG